MDEFCIKTENLNKIFDGKHALKNVNLEIKVGGVNAIVGSNGAGKSTLFKILLGMMSPTYGNASILGCDVASLNGSIRSKVGYVNEEHALPEWMRVEQVIEYQKHFYPQWDHNLFKTVVSYFDVSAKQKISQLSRGERAGLNLACAFAQKPELLILDEPTLGLDVIAKQSFLEAILFTEFNYHTTFIYCSHQMEEVQRVADNLIVMERGELKHNGDPDDFSEGIIHLVARPFSNWRALLDEASVLKIDHLEDAIHIWVLEDTSKVESTLCYNDCPVISRSSANLEQAINAFLNKRHSTANHSVRSPL